MRITLIPTAIHACALECTQETTVKVQWVKYNTIVFKHFVDLDTSTLCFLLDHRLNYNNHYIQSTVCSRLAAGNKLQESSKLCCFETLCRLRYIHTVFFYRTTDWITTTIIYKALYAQYLQRTTMYRKDWNFFCFETLCGLRYIHTVFFTGPQIELQQTLRKAPYYTQGLHRKKITGKIDFVLFWNTMWTSTHPHCDLYKTKDHRVNCNKQLCALTLSTVHSVSYSGEKILRKLSV